MTTPAHILDKATLPKLGHQLVHFYDLLAGPGMSDQERMSRELADSERFRFVGRLLG